ncbi:S24 family peptidase [Komagataeibacter sp. FNDCF1]|uniref:LexA family transcriptional regulator n=1 Tax=Komagataeibacter sp. FNDCF1 TaxID=2878681 RepID=UPI001E3F96FA|nr:S24 family peptidase [Komagataeibacter sp. FNDCF1]MCE2563739.1 peptidase [Komagataeibacter sp. FNDCF1]
MLHKENSDPEILKRLIEERSQRLKQAVKDAGGNRRVSNRSGIPFGTLNAYLAGREMRVSALVSLAKACNVPLDWLAEGKGSPETGNGAVASIPAANSADDSLEVKFFDAEPSAGRGNIPEEWVGSESYSVSRSFLSSVLGVFSRKVFFVRIQGDSMMPSLNAGDTILVNYETENFVEAVYVITIQGLLMVKRLSMKDPFNISVSSDNPRYQPFQVPLDRVGWMGTDMDADMRIIGRVVGRFQLNF